MFDMNQGQFEEYNEQESNAVNEVYQMYEEMLGIIKTEYNPKSTEELEEEGTASPATPRVEDEGEEAADSSDESLDRNPKASPIFKQGQFNSKFGSKHAKYEPRMTEVVEETEPESSFKETEKQKKDKIKRKRWSKEAVAPVIEEKPEYQVTADEDREDDFSEESEDEA